VEVEVGRGETAELEQANFRGAPSMVAGMFTLPFLQGHSFAYSFLTRRRSKSDLLLTAEERLDLFPYLPGKESYTGTWEEASDLDENWVGISWAHEVSPRVSVGLSTFGTYLGRKKRIGLGLRTWASTDEVSLLVRSREYRFSSFGLLWKAGIAADLAPFSLGLSLTTPQITAFGSGSIRYEDLRIPPDSTEGIPPTEETVVFREEGLSLTTRSPFAVGGGISWAGSRIVIHLSGEWYSGVSQYLIMGVDSIESQSSRDLHEYRVVDELESVLNFGAGIEWRVSDAFSAYGSIVKDASAAPKDPFRPFAFGNQISNSISQADGFHLGAGVSLEAKWVDLTAGVTYGSTRERVENPLTSGGAGFGQLIPGPGELELTSRRWRFLVGFVIPMIEGTSEEPGIG